MGYPRYHMVPVKGSSDQAPQGFDTFAPSSHALYVELFTKHNAEEIRKLTKNGLYSLSNLLDWENNAFHDTDMIDIKTVSLAKLSSIALITKKDAFKLGDTVLVDIVVRDHNGNRKTRGGDLVRIWVKGQRPGTSSAGYVIDRHDGTYIGVVRLLWTGEHTIVAEIAGTRENVYLLYRNIRKKQIVKHILGKYLGQNGSRSPASQCSSYRWLLPRTGPVCNLTKANSNLPWYCVKQTGFQCNTWSYTASWHPGLSYSPEEKRLYTRKFVHQKMNNSIRLSVKSGADRQGKHFQQLDKNLPFCNTLPCINSWFKLSPVGYLYDHKWYSTFCRTLFDGSVASLHTCLQGRRLWLFGDSTTRQYFSHLKEYLKMELGTEPWTKGAWHKPSVAYNKKLNYSMYWGPQAEPFSTGQTFEEVKHLRGTHEYLDKIPAHSKDIILIHFYLHMMIYGSEVLRYHARKTAIAVKTLSIRSPDVKILIKGPFSFIDNENSGQIGKEDDFWSVVYYRVLVEEFRSVLDHVIFMDVWDITLSSENGKQHPNSEITTETVNYMMSFVCH